MSLIAELKRRKVFKVGTAYLVVAWLTVQAASIAFPVFDAPRWALRVFILVALLGFPIALVFAWAFDVTPEGVEADARGVGTVGRGGKAIVAITAGLIALAFVWYFKGQPSYRAAAQAPATSSIRASEAMPPAPAINKQSIAVLAFDDLSPGRDQAYFSDGMAEEILNALARVKTLKVAGRSSSFYYKGRNETPNAIGAALGVANILQGSVRKQGEKVRITAQLIQAADGFQLWSQTYDGTLKDVFALQERIARAITDQLEVVLQGAQEQRLVNAGTSNPEAYALYLKATAIFNRRDGARFGQAMAQLQQAIALDPEFARAYSRLAALNAISANYRADFDASMAAVEKYSRLASALDPTLAEPYAALGQAMGARRRYREQREAFTRAIALDPGDVTANFWQGVSLITTGYYRQGKAALDRALRIDPLLPTALLWRGTAYVADGDLASAERVLRRADEGGLAFIGLGLSALEQARGNRAAAIAQLARGLKYFAGDFPPEAASVFARASFGDPVAKQQALALIDAYLASRPARIASIVPYVLIRSGEIARGLALMQEQPTNNDALLLAEVFSTRSPARRAPEFAEFARRMGLAAYWDVYGPPDQCRKAAGGDYVCE